MKVSIIVPVYNVEKYIEKCLNSLVNQTLKDIEIIIINDGSSDSSQKIIDEYSKKYNNIKVFIQENKGQAAARNFGLEKANGKYITYVDSDDFIELNMIERLYNVIEKNNYDIVISDIIKEENQNKFIFKNYWNIKKETNKNFMTSHLGPVARLYKRQFLIDNNFKFLEGVIYEDLGSLPILAMNTNKIGYISEAFYHYIIRKGSVTNQIKYNKKLEDIFKVMEHLSKNITKDYQDELEYLYIEHLLYATTLRLLEFDKYDLLKKVKKIMHDNYPNYNKNIYYRNKSLKFKLICFLSYYGFYKILKILKRIGEKND